jgi:hypothetical protein
VAAQGKINGNNDRGDHGSDGGSGLTCRFHPALALIALRLVPASGHSNPRLSLSERVIDAIQILD